MAVRRRRWEPVAFASPSLALIALVILFPLAYSFYLSLQNFDLAVGPEHDFVGAKNYIEALFKDGRFLGSIWNTAVIIAPSLVCELLLGLGIALLLGRMMLVLLAGLQSIPQELYESARVDGASAWQSFWSITLPLLKFTMAVGVMIRLIDLTKLFGLIFVLTFGGPGSSTETVAFTTYLVGFKDFRMSYAAALSYVIVGGVLVLTLLFMWVQRAREARTA